MKKQIAFRPDEFILSELEARAGELSIHQIANRDLERYYTMFLLCKNEIVLNDDEFICLCHVHADIIFDKQSISVFDSLTEVAFKLINVQESYNIEPDKLVKKLRKASLAYKFYLADKIEKFRDSKNLRQIDDKFYERL